MPSEWFTSMIGLNLQRCFFVPADPTLNINIERLALQTPMPEYSNPVPKTSQHFLQLQQPSSCWGHSSDLGVTVKLKLNWITIRIVTFSGCRVKFEARVQRRGNNTEGRSSSSHQGAQQDSGYDQADPWERQAL